MYRTSDTIVFSSSNDPDLLHFEETSQSSVIASSARATYTRAHHVVRRGPIVQADPPPTHYWNPQSTRTEDKRKNKQGRREDGGGKDNHYDGAPETYGERGSQGDSEREIGNTGGDAGDVDAC